MGQNQRGQSSLGTYRNLTAPFHQQGPLSGLLFGLGHFLAKQECSTGCLALLVSNSQYQLVSPNQPVLKPKNTPTFPNVPWEGGTAMVEDYWVHLPITSELRKRVSKERRQGHRIWDKEVGLLSTSPPPRHRADSALILGMAGGLQWEGQPP